MYPAVIDEYVRPTSVDEALKTLKRFKAGDAMFIAGGQSLMQAVKSRLVRPRCLVDLQAIKELSGVTVDASGVRIGAMTRFVAIAGERKLKGAYQALSDAAAHVGDRQVRNRGTIGGSLCWNYIAACMPAVALGLGLTLELLPATGSRRKLAAETFLKGPFETARADDEILLAVSLPAAPAQAGSAYKKWGIVTDALPVVGICAYIETDSKGACRTARIAVGGLASGPKRAKGAEALLSGKSATDHFAIAAALDKAALELETQSDLWADESYRKQLIRTVGAEVVGSAFARAAGK